MYSYLTFIIFAIHLIMENKKNKNNGCLPLLINDNKVNFFIYIYFLLSRSHVYINPQWGADGKCVQRAWSVFRRGAGSISIKLYRSTASQPPSPFQSTAESSAAWNPENTSLIETEITTGINRNYWGTQHLT